VIVGSVIALSGSPGTGKSVVGKLLAADLDVKCIELNTLIFEHQLHLGEDANRGTLIADIEKVRNYLVNLLDENKERYVIVGHFADEVPEHLLEVLIILRCNPVVLSERLKKKGWPRKKIFENLQAELLGDCTSQALVRHDHHQIFEIDTSEMTPPKVVEAIKSILAGKGSEYIVGRISWLRRLNAHLVHQIMEEKRLPS